MKPNPLNHPLKVGCRAGQKTPPPQLYQVRHGPNSHPNVRPCDSFFLIYITGFFMQYTGGVHIILNQYIHTCLCSNHFFSHIPTSMGLGMNVKGFDDPLTLPACHHQEQFELCPLCCDKFLYLLCMYFNIS